MNKVLIVEDEAGIRDGIVEAYQWDEIGCEICGTAENGIEALEMCLTLEPTIVISDIVIPGIDGLMLIAHIKNKYPDMHFIVMSGHRNFEYAQKALNLGADFFLSKPIDYEELRRCIQTISNRINKKNEQQRQIAEKETIVREIVKGGILHKSSLSAQGLDFLNNFQNYSVGVLRFDDFRQEDYVLNRRLLQFVRGMLTDNIMIYSEDSIGIVFLIFLNDPKNYLANTKEFFLQLQESINQFFSASCSIGISEVQQGHENLSSGFRQALQALGQTFYSGSNSINFYLDLAHVSDKKSETTDYNSVIRYCNKTVELLKYNTGVHLGKAGSSLFDDFISSYHGTPSFTKASFFVLCILSVQRVVGENNSFFAVLLKKYSNFQNIEDSVSLNKMKDIFINLLLDMSDYLNVKSSSKQEIMQMVIDFIKENYKDNISLGDIAQRVYLSPSYLSTLITNEIGKSYVDILNETRINASIELLKEKKAKISRIAFEVGYNEPQYYVTVFKKYTGVTPRKYRELYF